MSDAKWIASRSKRKVVRRRIKILDAKWGILESIPGFARLLLEAESIWSGRAHVQKMILLLTENDSASADEKQNHSPPVICINAFAYIVFI